MQKQETAMNIPYLLVAINGFLVVAIGAFGAHALDAVLTAEQSDVYQTGVQYHMFHLTGLLLAGLQRNWQVRGNYVRTAAWLFQIGIVLFSGSLYLLAITGSSWLGMITPLGGIAFLGGWSALLWALIKQGRKG